MEQLIDQLKKKQMVVCKSGKIAQFQANNFPNLMLLFCLFGAFPPAAGYHCVAFIWVTAHFLGTGSCHDKLLSSSVCGNILTFCCLKIHSHHFTQFLSGRTVFWKLIIFMSVLLSVLLMWMVQHQIYSLWKANWNPLYCHKYTNTILKYMNEKKMKLSLLTTRGVYLLLNTLQIFLCLSGVFKSSNKLICGTLLNLGNCISDISDRLVNCLLSWCRIVSCAQYSFWLRGAWNWIGTGCRKVSISGSFQTRE